VLPTSVSRHLCLFWDFSPKSFHSYCNRNSKIAGGITGFIEEYYSWRFLVSLSPLLASNIAVPDRQLVGWCFTETSRTTFDILWTCISIMIVCTYKVMHLNIASKGEISARWWQWPFWKYQMRVLKWMVIMALSPEIALSISMRDWLWARESVKRFTTSTSINSPPLHKHHSHFSADIESIAAKRDGPQKYESNTMNDHK